MSWCDGSLLLQARLLLVSSTWCMRTRISGLHVVITCRQIPSDIWSCCVALRVSRYAGNHDGELLAHLKKIGPDVFVCDDYFESSCCSWTASSRVHDAKRPFPKLSYFQLILPLSSMQVGIFVGPQIIIRANPWAKPQTTPQAYRRVASWTAATAKPFSSVYV